LYAWHVPANFLVLRLISFNCDYHWAVCAKYEDSQCKKEPGLSADASKEVASARPSLAVSVDGTVLARQTAALHRPLEEYSILNCISYCIYAPLYVAGPIVTFNTYMEYSKNPQKSESE
jgi:protein-cysteine N-palmitoyltransferase HHAT